MAASEKGNHQDVQTEIFRVRLVRKTEGIKLKSLEVDNRNF